VRRLRAADFEEFGTAPVAFDLYLDNFDGSLAAIKPFRDRCGWLMVAEAQFPMPFITWRRTLVVCVSDHGEVFAPSTAKCVFSIPTSLPRAADDYPPDTLDEAMDDLYRRFIRRTQRDNLAYLAEAQGHTQEKIAVFESECRAREVRIVAALRGLRAERRRADISPEARAEIDSKLMRLSALADDFGPWMRERIRDMRAEDDDLEQAVLDSLSRKGVLEHRYVVRWRARSARGCPPVRLAGRKPETETGQVVISDQSTLVRTAWVNY